MAQTKRSKRHRQHRNKISTKDLVNANATNVQWAQEVHRNERKRYKKGEFAESVIRTSPDGRR